MRLNQNINDLCAEIDDLQHKLYQSEANYKRKVQENWNLRKANEELNERLRHIVLDFFAAIGEKEMTKNSSNDIVFTVTNDLMKEMLTKLKEEIGKQIK
jgi:regulator of replication initiation timing